MAEDVAETSETGIILRHGPKLRRARSRWQTAPGEQASVAPGTKGVRRREEQSGNGRRDRIFRRDDFRCVYCGGVFPPEDLTVDHVQPRMRGGDMSDGNLVTACRACNTAKAGQPAWAFLARRREQRENFLRYAAAVWARHRRAVEEAAREAPASREEH